MMAEEPTPLREELACKAIVDFTPEEFLEAGFKGDGKFLDVPEDVSSVIREIEDAPELLDFITGYMIDIRKRRALQRPNASSTNSHTMVKVTSDYAPPVGDDFISKFEARNYYVGLSENEYGLPRLKYRTSSKTDPFPTPAAGEKFLKLANKTAHGAWDKVLTRDLWNNTVGNQIIDQVLEPRGIKYSSLKAVRFSSGKSALGPIVIWIGLHAGKVTFDQCRDASPAILQLLEGHGVMGMNSETV